MSKFSNDADQACQLIVADCSKRFEFCAHLSAAQLLSSDRFREFSACFPEEFVDQTVCAYPFLNKEKLVSELKVLYDRSDLQTSSGAMGMYTFLLQSGLQKFFRRLLHFWKLS